MLDARIISSVDVLENKSIPLESHVQEESGKCRDSSLEFASDPLATGLDL